MQRLFGANKMDDKSYNECHRALPEGYKYKCCESCRNKQAKKFKDGCKGALGVAVMFGATAVAIITKGNINPHKD